jgi:hypothetical protein
MKRSTLLLLFLMSDAALLAAGLFLVTIADKRWERYLGNGLLIATVLAGGLLMTFIFR